MEGFRDCARPFKWFPILHLLKTIAPPTMSWDRSVPFFGGWGYPPIFLFFIFVPVSPAVGDRWWMSQHIGPRRPRNNRKWFHFNFRCVPVFVFCQTCSEVSTDELVLPLWTGRFCSSSKPDCLIFISSLIFLVEHLLIFFFYRIQQKKKKKKAISAGIFCSCAS